MKRVQAKERDWLILAILDDLIKVKERAILDDLIKVKERLKKLEKEPPKPNRSPIRTEP